MPLSCTGLNLFINYVYAAKLSLGLNNLSGGSSTHGAAGGSSHGKVDGTVITTGSGGGGANGGAGGNFLKIDYGKVS